MASLLDWLRKRGSDIMEGGDKWQGVKVEPTGGRRKVFPLDAILKGMAKAGDWPERTNEASEIRFVAISNRRFGVRRTIIRDFVDLPGERFSDFLGSTSHSSKQTFQAWSNAVRENFPHTSDPSSINEFKEYLALLQSEPKPSADDLVSSYRALIEGGAERFRYLQTPSTILSEKSTTDGVLFTDHFAPLPEGFGTGINDLHEAFAGEFKRYQKQVIEPLRGMLASADAIVIPVDVGWILSSGMASFHDQRTLVEAFANYLSQIHNWWHRLVSLNRIAWGKGPTRLSHVIVCGTKLDIFAPDDQSRLEDLVKTFAANIQNSAGLVGVKVSYITCSAMVACSAVEGKPESLQGYIEGQKREKVPSRLPDQWPGDWQAGQFQFGVDFDPRLDRNMLYPPRQQNLEKLMNLLES